MRRLLRPRRTPSSPGRGTPVTPNERYLTDAPSAQAQLDLFAGAWTSQVPVPDTVSGDRADLFADERIDWALQALGGVSGQRVLELGPLEAGHTTMLERAGAADVVAVEAHTGAFLRCLVVKNLLGLRARFELGDFVGYLQASDETFDLVLASGVLYHMTAPLELLHLVATHARRVALWTHYWDADVLEQRPDVAARFDRTRRESHGGYACDAHVYAYREGPAAESFCGGTMPTSAWLARADILAALDHYGLGDQQIGFDDPFAPHGPAFAVVARRG